MVREIANVYHSLPEPISPHGWYYFHTLRTHRFRNVYVSTGIDQQRLEHVFGQVVKAGLFSHPYCMPYENNKPVYICRNPKYDMKEYWTTVRY